MIEVSRRTLLGAMATSPLIASQSWSAPMSLADLAVAKGLRFGSAVSAQGLNDPQIAALLISECNLIVAENEMKSYVINASGHEGVYNFGPGDKLVDFAKTHKMAIRGHNLYWAKDQYTPKWVLNMDFGANPKAMAEKFLRDYIGHVCDHYGNQLTSWDVVNEAIDEKTGEIRDNLMYRILGMDYFRICYETAREHLPHMQLVYNDYMSWGEHNGLHRKGVLGLLRWFRDKQIPINALGIQGHLGTVQGQGQQLSGGGDALPQYDEWQAFLKAADTMGYEMLITEFDINDRKVVGDIATRDQKVAETAKTFLDMTLDFKSLKDVLCWGLDDKHSWLQHRGGGDNNIALRPCPYDDQFKAKPFREAIAQAFRSAPDRR